MYQCVADCCSSWPTRCRPSDHSPPQVARRPGAAPTRPACCWPAAPIAGCSSGCGSWPRAHLSPRHAGAGRCSSWPTRCRPGDRSPPQVGRRPGVPVRPARCWPAAPIARCSSGCRSWWRAHLVAAARRCRARTRRSNRTSESAGCNRMYRKLLCQKPNV